MKRTLCLLAAILLFLGTAAAGADEIILLPEDVMTNQWFLDEKAKLTVGNPTPLTGHFFTTMWGGTTSDLDVQDLLYAYSPIRWDGELGRFRFDRSVVEDALVSNDDEGNRTYLMVLAEDLLWSDGTPVTARDYAFSLLLQTDPAVAETGGTPLDSSWLAGSDEYRSGEAGTLSGLRIIADNILQITMKAESLPYFYELNRLNILPYPAAEIAPGIRIMDDGEGVYLSQPLTADLLREYVLDETIGYLSHPRVVSGPYVLASFNGTAANFAINPLYKGNEEGMVPRIGEIEYTKADNENMISQLADGRLNLLNKVTKADTILQGIQLVRSVQDSFSMENETRTGLTMLWFTETGLRTQDAAVRKAVAHCFDRDGFIREYTGRFGMKTDGFYGLGQWMYRIGAGIAEPPAVQGADRSGWESVSLDGLTLYEYNIDEAIRLLEEAGWNLNENGEHYDGTLDLTRYKQEGRELSELVLTLLMPESPEERRAIETCLVGPLRRAGITLRVKTASMETIVEIYKGRAETDADILYLGENFSIVFDPEILAPYTQGTELGSVKEELYGMALDMVRTEPEDLLGFEQKWISLQEKITETLPLLPVYTNVYFDFFSRKLHNYRITQAPTWGQAIVSAYMSDMEEIDEAERQRIQEKLDETGN